MKYVILIYSHPQPWGHPTGDYLVEFQALPKEERESMNKEFDALLDDLSARGELVVGEALGDPATSRLYRWETGEPIVTDGPYSESKEHLAGFFVIDVESAERAQEIGARFASRGHIIELRPMMWPGGTDE